MTLSGTLELGETYVSDEFVVRDTNEVLANAGSVTCTVTLPDGTTTSPTVTNTGTGLYAFDYLTTQAGPHSFIVTATGGTLGSVVRKFADSFNVSAGAEPHLISLSDAKRWLNIPDTSTEDDDEVLATIGAITTLIEAEVGAVVRRTVVEQRAGGSSSIVLDVAPVLSITSVTESGVALTSDAYELDGTAGILYRSSSLWPVYWPTSTTRLPIEVTYVVGRATVPPEVQQAAKAALKSLWRAQRGSARQQAPADGSTSTLPYVLPNGVLELLGADRALPGIA